MFFQVDETTRRRAKTPHELAMVNLIVFNLLIGVALLAGSMAQPDSLIARYKWVAVGLPLALSLVVIGTTWLIAARSRGMPWLIGVHWRLSASRYRLLGASYVLCAAILSLAFLGGADEGQIEARIHDLPPAMQEMERHKLESQDLGGAIWARIAVVPLLIAVMVSILLESGSIYQASRGEVPDRFVERFPPPSDLEGLDDAPV